MSLEDQFPKGCRVGATAAHIAAFKGRSPKYLVGTIVGYSQGQFIKVQRDGLAKPQLYAPMFWERIE